MRAWLLIGILLPLAPAGTARAQDLDRVLRDADAAAARGDFAAAHRLLREGLEPEDAAADVLARYGEIRRRLADWAFRERYPELGPAQLLAGEVVRWKEKTHHIRLRYDWAELAEERRLEDFEHHREDWLFRIPVGEEFRLEIRGDWSQEAVDKPISLLCGVDAEAASGWRFTPGFHRRKVKPEVRMPRRASRFGEPRETLVQTLEDLEEPAGEYHYVLECRRGKLTLRRGSKRLGDWKTRFPERLPGRLGFHAPGLRSIQLDVDFDADAWAEREEARLTELKDRFRSLEYDPLEDMPAWFRKRLAASQAATPWRPPPAAMPKVAEAWPALLAPEGPPADFEAWAADCGAEGGLRHYARAIHAARRGAWIECGDAIRAAAGAGLDFGPQHLLLARAQFFLGERKQALVFAGKYLEDWPDDAGRVLVDLTGRHWGPRESLKVLDRVVAAGGLSLLERRNRLQEALAGPLGENSVRATQGSVEVLGDTDPAFVRRVAAAALDGFRAINMWLRGVVPPLEPLLILHFGEEASRRSFCERLGLPLDSTGYLPELHLILLAGDPRDQQVQDRLLEAVWQVHLDSTLDMQAVPDWVVSGYGSFLASNSFLEGTVRAVANGALVRKAAENGDHAFFQPHQLINLSHEEWLKHPDWVVCESWLLVHFLEVTRDTTYQGRADRYFDALKAGKDRTLAWQEAFGDLDQDAFTAAFELHRRGLIERQ